MPLNLDLYLIDTKNSLTLGVADISSYPKNFIISSPSLEVTPPGYNKVSLPFTPKAANFYRASDLGITCSGCAELPDGIYLIKYSVHPVSTNFVEKSFIRVEQLKNKYLDAFLKLDLECSPTENDIKLKKVKLLVEGSIAASLNCDMEKAYRLYKKAEDMLNNIC